MAELTKSMEEIAVHDESFDVAKGENYTLMTLLSSGGVACAVHDRIENRFIALAKRNVKIAGIESAIAAFEKLRAEIPWLNSAYRSEILTFPDKNFTLIPTGLFESEKRETYLNFSGVPGTQGEIQHHSLSTMNAILVYRLPVALRTLQSAGVKVLHQAGVSIDAILLMNKNKPGKRVYAFIHKHSFEILVISGHSLILYNIFEYQDTDELVYHIMNIYESLELNPESIPVFLSGEMDKNSAAYALLYKYIRHVDMLGIPEHYSFSYKLSELNPGRFFGLFSQLQCVS